MARSRSSGLCVSAADAAHDITTAPSKRTFFISWYSLVRATRARWEAFHFSLRAVRFTSVFLRRAFGNADPCGAGPRSDSSEGRREFRHSALREDAAKRRWRNRYHQIAPG